MRFRDCLNEESKELWKVLYRAFMHKDEPEEIHVDLETPEEMVEIMEETPNYTISKQGRE